MAFDDTDYIQLSGIQHFAFCRRQWALIHIEQQWAENTVTIRSALNEQSETKIEALAEELLK